jgi:serine O-acetyltransferase
MDKSFIDKLYQAHQACPTCPSPAEVASFFNRLLGTLFPEFTRLNLTSTDALTAHMDELRKELDRIVNFNPYKNGDVSQVATTFFDVLPSIYDRLNEDVEAMYAGDPAAKTRKEVIQSYPGFYAVAAYRIAHQLHQLGVRGIPRMITEHAHSKTGIDIHPSAAIGRHFCIDHGTGVVIGETAVIGDHVKIYQGVTLGALSVDKNDASKKRHPTLEDYVVVYAGATILGGETVIGHHSVVGGNVWLTRSLPAHSKIYYQAKMYNGENDETDIVIFKAHHDK